MNRLKSLMNSLSAFVAFVALLLSAYALADKPDQVITEDGRLVQLNADGSWNYLNRDRYATNARGERYVLYPNGQWRRLPTDSPDASVSGTPATVPENVRGASSSISNAGFVSKPANGVESVQVALTHVAVFRSQTKKLKSVRTESETHFTISLLNTSTSPVNLDALETRAFSAETSSGRKLSVQRIESTSLTLEPGQTGEVKIICSSSPRWKSVKYLRLNVQSNTLGSHPSYILDRSLRDVEFLNVESL